MFYCIKRTILLNYTSISHLRTEEFDENHPLDPMPEDGRITHIPALYSSRGLGRVPLKDKTRVRIPYGAKKPVDKFSAGFLYSIGCL